MSKKTVFILQFLSGLFRKALPVRGSNRRASSRGAQIDCGTARAGAQDIRPREPVPVRPSAGAQSIRRRALPGEVGLRQAPILQDTKGIRRSGRERRGFGNGKSVSTRAAYACLR